MRRLHESDKFECIFCHCAGSLNAENNLRHDWHSLLTASAPSVGAAGQRVLASDFLFTEGNYSNDYYPHADTLVRYLQDFATRHQLNIKYAHRALSVYRVASGASSTSAGAGGMDADRAPPSPSARALRDMAPGDIPPLRIELAIGENTPGATVCVCGRVERFMALSLHPE